MAAQLLNTIGKLGVGLAVGASVVNTALYNGMTTTECRICVLIAFVDFSGRRHPSRHL